MTVAAVKKDAQAAVPVEITDVLARHIAGLQYAAIPAAAIAAAKRFMLDTLAVGWAGTAAPGCPEAHALLQEEGGRADATAWSYGGRLPAMSAAFINSMSGAALDFDSLGRDSPAHVNVVVLPAALALAEREHRSGRDFLAALVAGCDLQLRFSGSCEARGEPHKGWFYTSVHGVFGSAAAAASLLKLDAAATRHALGIAYSQAAGTQQANIEPSLTKRMQSAFAARAGVFAALLAARGISAPRAVIEGQCGLYRMYQDGDVARLLGGLGSTYENGNLSIKKYPSCGCNHTALEGALQLARQYDLKPDDIESMEVEISPFMARLVGGPFDPSGDAQVAAQFNIGYSIACAIIHRRFGLAELEENIVRDPAIRKLVDKVRVVIDPANTGKRGPMDLRIQTRTHGRVECRVVHVPGTDEAPMSEEEVAEKCRQCFALGVRPLSSAATARLLERVAHLEDVPDMAEFFTGL